MEKIKVSKEVYKALGLVVDNISNKIKTLEATLMAHSTAVSGDDEWCNLYAPLNQLTMEEFSKALLFGYEKSQQWKIN